MILNNYVTCIIILFSSAIIITESPPNHALSEAFATDQPLAETRYVTYFNPYDLIKIQYPSYWNKSDIFENHLIMFESPLDTVGVIIQNMPTPGISIDEFTMNIISIIRTYFPHAQILDTKLASLGNESSVQDLLFTYEHDNLTSKILLKIRSFEDSTFMFAYYSDQVLFDRFYPIANHMYRSVQSPEFTKIFDIDINKNESIEYPNQNDYLHYDAVSNNTHDVKNTSKRAINDNYLDYKNQNLDLEFKYPGELKVVDLPQGVLMTSQNKMFGGSVAKIPLNNYTMDEFITSQILHLNESLDDFSILNSSISDILDFPTQMISFNYTKDFDSFQGVQIWKQVGESVFIITFYADTAYFEKYLPQIGGILSTLEFTKGIGP